MRLGIGIVVATLLSVVPATAIGQLHHPLPFAVGERLTYRVQVPKFHASGRGSMWVEGPVVVRGVASYLLHFDINAGFGPFKGRDHARSWLDPERLTSLRYEKIERSPFARHDELVELFPSERRWEAGRGRAGESATDQPLDELSFIYFLRTVDLDADPILEFHRHFDARRNPTRVLVLGREEVTTRAGTFRTIAIELRVKDPRRFTGEGVIRINLTEDSGRLPVRIESTLSFLGTTVLSLESHTHDGGAGEIAQSPAPR